MPEPGRLIALSRTQSLRLLAGVGIGRVVFTERALPAIRPVNHVVDNELIVIRTHLGASAPGSVGMVVAYQADEIDPVTRTGWSVIATGIARRVVDPGDVARYERTLRSWLSGEKGEVLAIRPEIVTGFRLGAG